MLERSSIGAIILATALLAGCDAALAFDEAKYPDARGPAEKVHVLGENPQGVDHRRLIVEWLTL
jgi:hypothetical protein